MTTQTRQPISGTDTAAVAVFDNHEFAAAAVKQLVDSGFDIKKVTVVGRGLHSEESVAGFYNAGDRVKFWGTNGAFWGGLWGLLMGGSLHDGSSHRPRGRSRASRGNGRRRC
jgi:hypothetical protein